MFAATLMGKKKWRARVSERWSLILGNEDTHVHLGAQLVREVRQLLMHHLVGEWRDRAKIIFRWWRIVHHGLVLFGGELAPVSRRQVVLIELQRTDTTAMNAHRLIVHR
jgi:hypothetical protein